MPPHVWALRGALPKNKQTRGRAFTGKIEGVGGRELPNLSRLKLKVADLSMAADKEEEKGVKLFSMWASPFGLRVEWALRLKGVDYEYVDEDLPHHKSPELLRLNPVTKKIPVLVHHGRPIAESLVIIEYIDEAWSHRGHPILPADPYHRAQARFWARFAEDKILPATLAVSRNTGNEMKAAVEELQEELKTLEGFLEGKKFFGGEKIGYLDLAVGWLSFWLRMIEEVAGITIVSHESHPLINEWFESFLNEEVIKERLPPKDKIYALNRGRREQFISGQLTYNK